MTVHRPLWRVASATLSMVAPAIASQPVAEIGVLIPEDAEPSLKLGTSVANFGSMVIASAHRYASDGVQPQAYIYDTSVPTQPTLVQILEADVTDNPYPNFIYGCVAIGEDTALIGSPYEDTYGNDEGAAYLFDIDSGQRIRKLLSPDAIGEERFGNSIAIGGQPGSQIVLITASPQAPNIGSVHIFDAYTGGAIASIQPPAGADDSRFGLTVHASRSLAAISGTILDDDNVYRIRWHIYEIPSFQHLVTLERDAAGRFDYFGDEAAISDTLVAIAATGEGFAGVIHVVDPYSGNEVSTLKSSNPGNSGTFGRAMDFDGTRLLVGEYRGYYFHLNTGSLHLYDFSDPFSPARLAFMQARDQTHNWLGFSLALHGTTAIAGAPIRDYGLIDRVGGLFLFDQSPRLVRPDTSDDPCVADWNGDSLVNEADFIAYFTDYVRVLSGDPPTTSDPDLVSPFGIVNSRDFTTYCNRYADGCP